MLALTHLLVWCWNRRSGENLCFFVMAIGVIGLMAGELGTMYAETPAAYGEAGRWSHLVYGIAVAGSLGFVHFYFGTGRPWLLMLALGSRLVAVMMNFAMGVNLHILSIHSLAKTLLLGEQVSILGEWVPNPCARVGQLAALLQLLYVVDASLRLWRSGQQHAQRRALLVGGGLAFFIVFASVQAGLVAAGVLRMPFIVSLPFLCVVLAMGYKLSRDMLRATQLARDLRESEERMTLAAEAAHLGIWIHDLERGEVWATDKWRALLGFTKVEPLEFDAILQRIHPEDRESVRQVRANALRGDGSYDTEYRVVLPDGQTQWIGSRGRVEFNDAGKPVLVRGVSLDINGRKRAELEAARHRRELAHLSRISILGELAGAIAHELNQPLAAMLSNAQVGRRSLNAVQPELVEMAEIFDDITADAKRAGGIIHGMRAMFKKDASMEAHPVDLNEAVNQAVALLHSEMVGRKVSVSLHLGEDLPLVMAGRVGLQQVLINLVLNALEAVKDGNGTACIEITTAREHDQVVVGVRDNGPGIPAEFQSKLFEPFASTKPGGLGLGLAISRGIAEGFGGELLAANHPDGGAVFRMLLPVAP